MTVCSREEFSYDLLFLLFFLDYLSFVVYLIFLYVCVTPCKYPVMYKYFWKIFYNHMVWFESTEVLCRKSLLWRHHGHDNVSNRQPDECLLNRLSRRKWRKTSKPRVTGLCAGNSPWTGEFPAQRASNTENVSIWWRHHESAIWDMKIRYTKIKYHIVRY